MADSEQHVSSTTPLFNDEVHHYQAEPDLESELYNVDDDIVDLVGGARDALERHRAEDSAPDDFTQTSLPDPEEPLPEPVPAPAVPDTTSPTFPTEEPEAIAPKAKPESANITPEPQAAAKPEPAPENDALPVAEPRKAAPSPAEAAERSALTEEPAAPASCEYYCGINELMGRGVCKKVEGHL